MTIQRRGVEELLSDGQRRKTETNTNFSERKTWAACFSAVREIE